MKCKTNSHSLSHYAAHWMKGKVEQNTLRKLEIMESRKHASFVCFWRRSRFWHLPAFCHWLSHEVTLLMSNCFTFETTREAEACSEGEVGARCKELNKGNCFSLEQPPMQEFWGVLISCYVRVCSCVLDQCDSVNLIISVKLNHWFFRGEVSLH